MTTVPPEPGTDPREAVPLAGMLPRRRPEPPLTKDPLSPEPELLDEPDEPLDDEPPLDEPPPPTGDAVPTDVAPPLLVCCAAAAIGNARETMNTVEDRCRVIWFTYATRLPINQAAKPGLSSPERPHFLTPFRADR